MAREFADVHPWAVLVNNQYDSRYSNRVAAERVALDRRGEVFHHGLPVRPVYHGEPHPQAKTACAGGESDPRT